MRRQHWAAQKVSADLLEPAARRAFNVQLTRAAAAIPYDLAALDDIAVTTPADGQFLVYDGAAKAWINAPLTSGMLPAHTHDAGTLAGTTLAATVVTSSLTTVGALAAGSIVAGFGGAVFGAPVVVPGGTGSGAAAYFGADRATLDAIEVDTNDAARFVSRIGLYRAGANANFKCYRLNGTLAAYTALVANDIIGVYTFGGATSSTTRQTTALRFYALATEDWDTTQNGAIFTFSYTPRGHVGDVGILHFNPDTGALSPGSFQGTVAANSNTFDLGYDARKWRTGYLGTGLVVGRNPPPGVDAVRVDGNLSLSSGMGLKIGGVMVLDRQVPFLADTATGSVRDAECRADLAALKAALRGVHLMALQ